MNKKSAALILAACAFIPVALILLGLAIRSDKAIILGVTLFIGLHCMSDLIRLKPDNNSLQDLVFGQQWLISRRLITITELSILVLILLALIYRLEIR